MGLPTRTSAAPVQTTGTGPTAPHTTRACDDRVVPRPLDPQAHPGAHRGVVVRGDRQKLDVGSPLVRVEGRDHDAGDQLALLEDGRHRTVAEVGHRQPTAPGGAYGKDIRPERRQQDGGSCAGSASARLPPTVPQFRTRTFPMWANIAAAAGSSSRSNGSAASRACEVAAPSSRVAPSVPRVTPRRPGTSPIAIRCRPDTSPRLLSGRR